MSAAANQTLAQFNWKDIGPDNLGGRTRSIVVANDGTVYAGSTGGGLWRSNNKGVSWEQVAGYNRVTAGQEGSNKCLTVSSIAIDPSDNTMYIGTGELLLNYDEKDIFSNGVADFTLKNSGYLGYLGQPGQGIFVSTDNGATFSNENGTWSSVYPFNDFNFDTNPFTSVQKVIAKDGRAIFGTLKGVYYTTDKCVNVTQSVESYDALPENFKDQDSLSSNPVYDLEFGSNGYVYATTRRWIFISTDNGVTFTKIIGNTLLPRDLTAPVPNPDKARMEVAVSPSNTDIVYAAEVSTGQGGLLVGTWKSIDKGETWTLFGPQSTALGAAEGGDPGSFAPLEYAGKKGKGRTSLVFAVDPSNPENVYLGGVNWYRYTVEEGWQNTTDYETFFPDDPEYVPYGLNAIAFDPADPKVIYLGSDSKIVRSADGGKTFRIVSSGYNTTKVFDVDVNLKGQLFVTTENADLAQKFNTESNNNFRQIGLRKNLRRYVSSSMLNPDYGIATGENMIVERTVNGGENYERFYGFPDVTSDNSCFCPENTKTNDGNCPEFGSGSVGDGFPPNTTLVYLYEAATDSNNIIIDSTNTMKGVQHLFMSEREHVWRIDRPFGANEAQPIWTRATPNTNVVGDYVSAITVSDAIDGVNQGRPVLFYGTINGKIYRATNPIACGNGPNNLPDLEHKDITPTNLPAGNKRWITGLVPHPTRPETLIVTMGAYTKESFEFSYVFASFNALDANPTFVSIHSSEVLPIAPIYCAMFNPEDPDTWLALGTESGVFRCNVETLQDATQGSIDWTEANDGDMSRVPVYNFGYRKYSSQRQTIPNSGGKTQTVRYKELYDYIYIATGGRGVMRSNALCGVKDDNASLVASGAESLKLYPNPANSYANVRLDLVKSANVTVEVLGLNGQTVKTVSYGELPTGTTTVEIPTNDLSAGMYVVKCTIRSGSLMNIKSGKLVINN